MTMGAVPSRSRDPRRSAWPTRAKSGTLNLAMRAQTGRGLLQWFRRLGSPPVDRELTRPEKVRATPFPQRDMRVDGLRLRYIDVEPPHDGAASGPKPREAGAPCHPVVLLPGHTSRIEEYDGLVPILARRRRVLVLDFPGSGYSDKPDRAYTLDLYERTVVGFLDGLGIDRADLAGGSLGGNLVLRLGHRLPARFPRLVAWAPAGAWDAQPRLADIGRVLRGYPLFWPMIWGQSRYWYAEDWPGRKDALDEAFTYYREVLSPGFVRMYWEIAGDQVRRSLFDLAPHIRQPTLLAWGDKDHGMNMGVGVARLHGLLPRAELRVFPGARHSLAAEVPAALARLIEEFLGRHDAEAPRGRVERSAQEGVVEEG
jgi:pimeloyl-ACP methyl ester carboxylesterase